MEAIPYKGFHIVITVTSERLTENKFRIFAQVYRSLNAPPILRNWLPGQEFASESAAYALGFAGSAGVD